jgi:uncharacterized protein
VIAGAVYADNNSHCLVPKVSRTSSTLDRMRGLLARPPLGEDEGLLIDRCGSVHTLGMSYPLDLVFLDRDGRIRKLVPELKPWRASGCFGAFMTLELAPGTIERLSLAALDRLHWREREAA